MRRRRAAAPLSIPSPSLPSLAPLMPLWLVGGGGLVAPGINCFDQHRSDAVVLHAESLCRAAREIDDAAVDIRSPIIDTHHDRAPIVEVRDAHDTVERQGAVRRRQIVHVIALAAGGR